MKTQRASYEKVRSLQRKLYRSAKADASRSYGVLYDKVLAWDTLCEAWVRVSRNRGGSGVDGVSIDKVKNEIGVEPFLCGIQEELAAGRYQAPPVKRSFIPKGDGKTRPLGVPTVRDRVVQAAVKLVIEPLLEADFCDCSHGFRPKRSNVNAARIVHQQVNYRKYVVVTDLKSYFDTINHDRLMVLLRRRIRDRRVLHLIPQLAKSRDHRRQGAELRHDGNAAGRRPLAVAEQPVSERTGSRLGRVRRQVDPLCGRLRCPVPDAGASGTGASSHP